jgi:hypothetical protein
MSNNRLNISRPNPFSTRFVRPGAIEYIFPDETDAKRMIDRLQSNGWRGEIVGPHGSGKSALLSTLIPAIRQAGKTPLLVELHDNQRKLPIDLARLSTKSVLIVDGYEQLGRWSRFRLRLFCRRHGIGLLITSHRPMGFPKLHSTEPTAELTQQIVKKLLDNEQFADGSFEEPDLEYIEKSLARHGGDIREILFELYDLYEQRRRGSHHLGQYGRKQRHQGQYK